MDRARGHNLVVKFFLAFFLAIFLDLFSGPAEGFYGGNGSNSLIAQNPRVSEPSLHLAAGSWWGKLCSVVGFLGPV